MASSLKAPGEPGNHPPVASVEPAAPVPCALQRFTDRVGDRAGQRARGHGHPSLSAFSAVAMSGYVVVATAMIVLGFILTDLLESGPFGRADIDATSWLADHRTAALDAVTSVASLSADTLGAISIALLVAVVLAVGRRWQAIAALVVGLVLELLVFLTVNYVVGRPRPDVHQLGSVPSTSSFPSGHTAATMVIYLLVAVVVTASTVRPVWRALAWVAVVVMPATVGFARVYRGMHHPTDVVAGALMGVAVLAVALVAVRAAKSASRPAHEEAADISDRPAPVRADVVGATG
jgi:membrane-associated phospholipid phosphatase